jgi:SAM-dependent methyltransferase
VRAYTELAGWWPLFSPPSHYVEEAADLLPTLLAAPDAPPATLLELGAGGGSLAYHLKAHMALTLSDISAPMLEISQRVNPECEHVVGDMRTIDLGRTFDVVLVHDAIMYATDETSVRTTLATAVRHCRVGGGIVVVPDCVSETFEAETTHGGEDAPDGRGFRYLEWSWDPDPSDTTYTVDYAFMLREADGSVRVEQDRHVEGLFPRATWLMWLRDAGFDVRTRLDPWHRDVFVGRKDRG